MNASFKYIDTDEKLLQVYKVWRECQYLALDTEFMRASSFFPHLALLQIADEDQTYVIDPLAIKDPSPIVELLQSSVIWVIHSCTEDLEALEHFYGVRPKRVFDSQLAADFVGLGHSMGYANLVEALETISLPKEHTRSNWLKRPLSEAQLNYAALDVVYLLSIQQTLSNQLQEQGKWEWFVQECAFLIKPQDDADNYYQKINGAWKLSPKQLALLKSLCSWREVEARRLDKPRNHVVSGQVLFEIALKAPSNTNHLKNIKSLEAQVFNTHGEQLLEIVEESQRIPKSDYPEKLLKPLSNKHSQLQHLKRVADECAEQLQLSASVLYRKKDLEYIVRHTQIGNIDELLNNPAQLPEHLVSWRFPLLTKPLLEASREYQ